MSGEAQQALPKVPRLLDPTGQSNPYDWREFDKFLQRLFALLGNVKPEGNRINVFNDTLDNTAFMQTPVSAQSTITTTQDPAHSDETNVYANAAPEASTTTYPQVDAAFALATTPASATTTTQDTDFLTLYWTGV